MENRLRETVHVSEIKPGDTIEIQGKLYTVCENNIKKDAFMGISIFGMVYFPGTGYQKVNRIKFINLS